MPDEWLRQARTDLLEFRTESEGWGYRPDSEPCVEPSVLASLALLATASADEVDSARSVARGVGDWLGELQQDAGSIGHSKSIAAPLWPTPYALWLWDVLDTHQEHRARSVEWLLTRRGEIQEADEDSVIAHDTALAGWPWFGGTSSWIEPTALTILVLRRAGVSSARLDEGARLILDRAIPGGGWNVGNSIVLGKTLHPRPAPTGLALLAIQSMDVTSPAVGPSVSWLARNLESVRSGQSLCWGLLALAGREPPEAGRWVEEAMREARQRSSPVTEIAYLLLAASSDSLGMLLRLQPRAQVEETDG